MSELEKKKKSSNANIGENEKNKFRQLEDRQRRNNLRIEGVKENDNESWNDTEKIIINIFENNLNVNGVIIERAHRTGIIEKKNPRTIVIKLLNHKDKVKILKNANKLKGSGIYINEDFSLETFTIRKKLLEESKLHRINVAETLNQFFVNIGPTLSSNIATTHSHFNSYLTSTNLNVMSNYKLTEKELLDAVSLLKPNKSLGFDDISSNVIIKSIKQITIPLLHIFNLSLKQGVFPDNLKIAKVIPVLKSGDPSDTTNYRPISILSCFSKILERVMYNRLYSYLNVNNILYHKQFGFKSGHSTDHAITHLVHDIFKGFNEDNCSKLGFEFLITLLMPHKLSHILNREYVYGLIGSRATLRQI
ncbi:uncharacterized protein LOC136094560 [Hydra vulgaris]|uniref:uncharacterized protein LOC136094560 n=1 Tax=Hydra vulgaris TaxID=6087 RepID=UPI0032EA425E